MTLPRSIRVRIGVGEGEVWSGRRSIVRRACRTEATPRAAVGAAARATARAAGLAAPRSELAYPSVVRCNLVTKGDLVRVLQP